MAPRPVVIFQKISPSDSSCTRLDVQSAGLGLRAAAAAPSPLPLLPWQETQLTFAIFSPCSTVFLSLGSGFFFAFSEAGATQGAWAWAGGGPPAPSTSSAAAARASPPMRAASEMVIESSLLNGSREQAGGRRYRPVIIDER